MQNSYDNNYQYNSCISRGICSPNPRTSSLQYILVLYLKLASYYYLQICKLIKDKKYTNNNIKNLILNTISIMVSNPEFSENDFNAISSGFNTELPKIIKDYKNLCEEQNIEPNYLKSIIKFDKPTNIIKSIQLGEKEFIKSVQSIPEEIQDLYKILLVLAKSMCTNILDLETFGQNEGFEEILTLLNFLNLEGQNSESIKELIVKITEFDNELMLKLFNAKQERYGCPKPKSVSYSTIPSKAVLVVGSSLRELEIILDSLNNCDIDVYTHDEMILAHTYPFFEKYTHLKGQFGQGTENCLIDFATFPGPIILTRHSLFNVENLYRGRLYTTDFAYSKGIIPIVKYDFSDVIKAANESKGFKTGKECESEIVGYDFDDVINRIDEKISSNIYSKILVIGLSNYDFEDKNYFETLFKVVDNKTLIISLSYCAEKENMICINACFDSLAIVRISEKILEKYNLPTVLLFPKCDRYTISEMIYFSSKNNCKIFVGKCTPISLNPSLIKTFTNIFKIEELSTPKKDYDRMFSAM